MRRDTADIPPADWAAALLAVDPGLGGICLRARAWPGREVWLAAALALSDRASARLPVGASEDRVFGGLDLAATLTAGRPVIRAGLVAEIGDGTLVMPMAERLETAIAARLSQALDTGARFAVLALDESDTPDTRPPGALMDRLAFWTSLTPEPLREALAPLVDFDLEDILQARALLPQVTVPDTVLEGLTSTAVALGIASLRAPLLAVRVARALAAIDGEQVVSQETAQHAAALVLAPRATQLPATEEPPQEADEQPPEAPPDQPDPRDPDDASDARSDDTRPPEDLILEAARAAIPADLLAQLAARGALVRKAGAGSGAGGDKKGLGRGRPAGTRRGDPRSGGRLDLVATLRAAAPWQPLRRKMAATPADPGQSRVLVTPDDFRIRQFKERTEKVVIFVVDASGSAALARLAETKGAIELMLAEAYVRREQVALIAFRGTGAELLLPPTRSLVQAKRRLSALPGGGATPLAAGLEAAALLADQVKRRGQSAHIALLTDGQANIARDGSPGRPQASTDAKAAALMLRATGTPVVLIDTGPRPRPQARDLAGDLGALYLPLPRADARRLSAAMQSALSDPAAA